MTWSDEAGQSTSPASGSRNYAYTVVAVDAAGNPSSPSAARTIAMDSVRPTTPAAPTRHHAGGIGADDHRHDDDDPGGAVSPVSITTTSTATESDKVNVSAIAAGGPLSWSDVAGQSTTSRLRARTATRTGGRHRRGRERVRLVAAARHPLDSAPPADAGCSVRRDARERGADDHVGDDDRSGGGLSSGVDHYDVYRDDSKVNVSAIAAGGPLSGADEASQSTSPPRARTTTRTPWSPSTWRGNQSAQSPARVIMMDTAAPTVRSAASPTGSTP